jgi:dTDP-4-dehydrorhamnose reductase
MNILLLGANGQLGRSFVEDGGLATRGHLRLATREGKCFDGTQAEVVDLSHPETLAPLLDRLHPKIIINAAAYTAVDRAESEEALATIINGESVGVLGRWAAMHDALVIHYSTDYVFSGDASTPYAVDAPTAPLGAYGRSKLIGEQALIASGAAYLMFRTAWVYAAHGNNFLRTMLRLANEREELRVVDDQYGSPTDTGLLVSATLAALDRWLEARNDFRHTFTGIYHLVPDGHTTWHGFATAIMREAFSRGLIARTPQLTPITTAQYPTPAKRPAWSVLDNHGFVGHFGYSLPPWQHGLHRVIETLSTTAP